MAQKKSFSLSELTFPILIALARKRRFLTVSVVSWIVIAILTIVVFLPQIQLIFSSLESIKASEEKFETIKTQVETLRNVDEAQLQKDLVILNSVLPVAKPVLPLLSSLESIAFETQVSLSNFQVNPGSVASDSGSVKGNVTESSLKGIQALPFQLEVTGSFESINTFFRLMDNQIPLINITAIQFSSAGSKPASGSGLPAFRAAVSIESLYTGNSSKPPAKGAAAAAVVLPPLTDKDRELLLNLSTMVDSSKKFELVPSAPSTQSGKRDLFNL